MSKLRIINKGTYTATGWLSTDRHGLCPLEHSFSVCLWNTGYYKSWNHRLPRCTQM